MRVPLIQIQNYFLNFLMVILINVYVLIFIHWMKPVG